MAPRPIRKSLGRVAHLSARELDSNVPEITWKSFAGMALFTCTLYGCFIGAMCYFDYKFPVDESETWIFDHPEPNYVILPQVAEFWSTLTTIPVAGFTALYLGIRFKYDWSVLGMYIMTCIMYTEAFLSHCTLERRIFSYTVTSVMCNAIYALAVFGWAAGGFMKHAFVRLCFAMFLFVGIVWSVWTLQTHPLMGEHPGLATLFVVQTPGVWAAWAGANWCLQTSSKEDNPCLYDSFKILTNAGVLLCVAMAASLIEVTHGFDYGVLGEVFAYFPYMHIFVHVIEQVGIYMYAVGVAGLQHSIDAGARAGSGIEWCGIIPYCSTTPPFKPLDVSSSGKISRETTADSLAPAQPVSFDEDNPRRSLRLSEPAPPEEGVVRRSARIVAE